MVQTIQAKDITLAQLTQSFGLNRTDEPEFFREWQDNLPELTDSEKQVLDEVKADYIHLSQYTLLEPLVKFVTNGSTFQFLKLAKRDTPKYARSDLFSLYSSHGLYDVVRMLKRIAQLVSQ